MDQIDFGDSDINWDITVENPEISVLNTPEGDYFLDKTI